MATPTDTRPTSAQNTARERIGTIGQAQQASPSSRERQQALIRQLRSEYGLTITDKMAEAIGKIYDNMIGQENSAEGMILGLAQARVTKRQDLEVKQAELAMNIMTGPEQTKAHIAGLATGLATLARFFGADKFADMVQAKADEIMSTIKVKLNTSGIEGGEAEMSNALDHVVERMQRGRAARGATAGATGFAETTPVPPVYEHYGDGAAPASAPPASRGDMDRKVSWASLEDAAKKAKIDQKGLESLRRSFDASKALKFGGDDTALDSQSEKLQLIQLAAKYLTEPQKKAVSDFVNSPAGPIESTARRGPN